MWIDPLNAQGSGGGRDNDARENSNVRVGPRRKEQRVGNRCEGAWMVLFLLLVLCFLLRVPLVVARVV